MIGLLTLKALQSFRFVTLACPRFAGAFMQPAAYKKSEMPL
jgi:hypothetical protein